MGADAMEELAKALAERFLTGKDVLEVEELPVTAGLGGRKWRIRVLPAD